MDDYKTRNISVLVLGVLTIAMLTMANTGSVAGLIVTIFSETDGAGNVHTFSSRSYV